MDTVYVGIQVALAAVLLVAAAGKLADLPGSRRAVRDFGVPERYAPALGTILPVAEGLLAIGLLIEPVARWAALSAALLFLVFIAAIAHTLRQGRTPDCHCFGQLHSEPAGPWTLVRNAVLALAALVLVVAGGRSIPGWVGDLSNAGRLALAVALGIVVLGAVELWLFRQIRGQNERILTRLQALEDRLAGRAPGAAGEARPASFPAPDFDVPALDGGRIRLQDLLARGKAVLLLFVDPNCGPCRALVPDMAEWNRRFGGELTVAWLSMGSREDNQDKFGEHGIALVGLQEENEVYREYNVLGTPSGVLVEPDGVVREPYATGRDRIRDLIAWAVSRHDDGEEASVVARPGALPALDPNDPATFLRAATGPAIGAQGTRVPLPDLDGGFASLDDYLGEETVLLFVGSSCAFTQRMLPDLHEWEAEAGEAVSRVLVVSLGSVEANRELGLRSRVVIDDGFTIARAFGATGTPAAIVIDAEGRVASPLATGDDAVLDLLWSRIEEPADTV